MSRETTLELRIGLLEHEVERLRLQLIVVTNGFSLVWSVIQFVSQVFPPSPDYKDGG